MQRRLTVLLGVMLVAVSCSAEGPAFREIEASLPAPSVTAAPDREPALRPGPPTGPTSPAPPDIAAADGEPGPLRLALVGEPVTDPARAAAVRPTDMVVVDLLYDGLTRWVSESGTWAPSLATTLVEADDGLSWTVELADASFSDGSPLGADDVVFSLGRVLDGGLTLPSARLEMVEGVVALDDRTVRIDLRYPFALLPELLSSPVYGIVAADAPDGSVGSGPLVRSGDRLEPRPVGAEIPLGFAGVEMLTVVDDADATARFEVGEVDLFFVSVEHEGDVDVSVNSTVEAHYVLNARAPQLGDVTVRAELARAVSRTSLSTAGYGAAAIPVDQVVPDVLACVDPCGGDVVSTSVIFDPLSIAYVADVKGREAALARALVDELAEAGIPAEATSYDVDTFVERASAGQDDLIRAGWVGLFPSPDSQLSPFTSTSAENISGLVSPAFDALFDAARRSGDPAAYRYAQVLLAQEAVVLPIARLQVRALVSDAVEGLVLRHDGTFEIASLQVNGTGP